MEPELEIIKFLKANPGRCVSGQAISRSLGISRSAVWKHITSLRKTGYRIEGYPKKGYAIVGGQSPPFNPLEISSILSTDIIGKKIHFFPSIGSTSAKAMELARGNAPEGTVVIADAQEKGRGRLERVWLSPAGVNLYTSIILRPPVPPQKAMALTLLSAVSVAESVGAFVPADISLKWPNDVLLAGKKVAGILTEMSSEVDRVNFAVIGIGVNVNMDMAKAPPDLRRIATSIMEKKGVETPRAAFASTLYYNLEKWYKRFIEEGALPVISAWRRLFPGEGKPVRVRGITESCGICLGIDNDGALLVRNKSGVVERVTSGDVE